jgi:hypothetical protein
MRYLVILFLMFAGIAASDIDYEGMPWFNMASYSPSSATTTIALDDADETRGGVWIAKDATTVTKVGFYVVSHNAGATHASIKYTAYINTVDATTGTPTIAGATSKEAVIGDVTAAFVEITFDTAFTPTAETPYAVWVQCTSTDPTTDYCTLNGSQTSSPVRLLPYNVQADADGAWTKTTAMPCVFPVRSDGVAPKGFMCGVEASPTYGNDHTPDQYATTFTVSQNTVCQGASIHMYTYADCEFNVLFIEDTTTIATVANDKDNLGSAAIYSLYRVGWPDYVCHTGHTYYIVLEPTGTAHINPMAISFPSTAYRNSMIGSKTYMSSRKDAGWTAYNSGSDYSVMMCAPVIGSVTTGTSTSGNTGFGGGFQ